MQHRQHREKPPFFRQLSAHKKALPLSVLSLAALFAVAVPVGAGTMSAMKSSQRTATPMTQDSPPSDRSAPHSKISSTTLHYPAAARGSQVDDYHGVSVGDPYRWLEDVELAATRQFVIDQNALVQPWLEALPQREPIRRRLEILWNYERVGVPRKKGDRYFFVRNDGKQNQSVLYVADTLDAAPRVANIKKSKERVSF